MHDVVLEALSAQVHVGKQAEQSCIVGKRALHLHAEIIGAGRNDQGVIVQLQRDYALLGGGIGKDNADAGLILSAVPLVV